MSNAVEGKMFGVLSIKSKSGKNSVVFLKGNMVFKLDEKIATRGIKIS